MDGSPVVHHSHAPRMEQGELWPSLGEGQSWRCEPGIGGARMCSGNNSQRVISPPWEVRDLVIRGKRPGEASQSQREQPSQALTCLDPRWPGQDGTYGVEDDELLPK